MLLLDNRAMAPVGQGQGLGRHRLVFAEPVARDTGCSRLRLYTHEVMTVNIALYTRAGFRENQRTHADGWRRVHMSKGPDRPVNYFYGALHPKASVVGSQSSSRCY